MSPRGQKLETMAGEIMRKGAKGRILPWWGIELRFLSAGVGCINDDIVTRIRAVEKVISPEKFPLPEGVTYYWEEKDDGCIDILVYTREGDLILLWTFPPRESTDDLLYRRLIKPKNKEEEEQKAW